MALTVGVREGDAVLVVVIHCEIFASIVSPVRVCILAATVQTPLRNCPSYLLGSAWVTSKRSSRVCKKMEKGRGG